MPFTVGKGEMVPGFEEGLSKMTVGDKAVSLIGVPFRILLYYSTLKLGQNSNVTTHK